MRRISHDVLVGLVACAVALSGCTSMLVHDEPPTVAASSRHCSGGEWADQSSVAVLPVPVVAFFVPHFDLQDLRSESYLNRCGESRRLLNREVLINRAACIPAGLTRIITLGIWQWCPTHIHWSADVTVDAAQSPRIGAPLAAAGSLTSLMMYHGVAL